MNIYISMAIMYLLLINTVENAYLLGICFIITMFLSDLIISLIKKIVNPNIRIPVSLLITGTIITVIEIITKKYIPGFYNDMNIYLPLMMLVIYDYDKDIKLSKSLLRTLKLSITYVLILVGLVCFKEILGNNTITLMDNISKLTGYRAVYKVFPDNNIIPMNIMIANSGAFILVGLGLGIVNRIKGGKNG